MRCKKPVYINAFSIWPYKYIYNIYAHTVNLISCNIQIFYYTYFKILLSIWGNFRDVDIVIVYIFEICFVILYYYW